MEWLEVVRNIGLIKKGKLSENSNIVLGKKIVDDRWEYDGELDENNMACGNGIARSGGKQFKGTWFQDKRHGIGMLVF